MPVSPRIRRSPSPAALAFLLLGFALCTPPGAGAAEPASTGRAPPPGQNRLALETSPYLLQHAGNPVDWYPWGEEAFAKARAENKPIFLSVGYSTCYWCHVMEREVFADPEIAAQMNEIVVSIKVDREERPDVDEIYMTAVQLMGSRGGWPMSVLLTPDLKPFFGATYIPREPFQGLLLRLQAAWAEQRPQLLATAEQVAAGVRNYADRSVRAEEHPVPAAAVVSAAAAQYSSRFDPTHGGFGAAPKFPQPAQLQALLTDFEARDARHSLNMVIQTLDAMARGGIHDQIGGGFHRYSTDERWRVPHFEKMLYDNAQLLHVYTRAFALTGDVDFRHVAEDIVAYIRREMTAPNALFYSAQDSEVDHEEGRSYVWTREEIRSLLSAEEFALAESAWGLDQPPDFEGRFILHWPRTTAATARAVDLTPEQLHAVLQPVRAKLLATRDRRPQPLTDDKAITAWNGMMIDALAYAARVLKRPEYARLADRAATALIELHRDETGALLHVSRHGEAKLPAFLDDYAALILGLLALHEAGGEPRWLSEALRLADQMIAELWDGGKGGFFQAPATVPNLLARTKESLDGAVPSGNSLAARALTALAAAGHERYAPYAAASLRAFAPILNSSPSAVPSMLLAVNEYHERNLPLEIGFPGEALQLPDTAGLVSLEVLREPPVGTDRNQEFTVRLEVETGWHVNATPASMDFLIPTTVSAEQDGRPVELKALYPAGTAIDSALGEWRVYSGRVEIPVHVEDESPAAGRSLNVAVRVQACNDCGRCLAPATLQQELELDAE